MEKEETSIAFYFSNVSDPRAENCSHNLIDIFTITILGSICGCEDWESITIYAQYKEEFLKQFLELPHGIPSHDTFERVFKRINPLEFEKCFIDWTKSLCIRNVKGIISIDGKTLRSSGDKKGSKSAIHMVSAWSDDNQLVLGQLKVDSKTNEIKAIPLLLDLLDIKGSIITIDAMGCQKEIAAKIVNEGADYILALKGNQSNLLEEVENAFNQCTASYYDKKVDKDHGRIETRECSVINDMDWIYESENWLGFKSIIKLDSQRIINEKIESETRYYISSLLDNATNFNSYIRKHWGIENSLHWVLDVNFNEDKNRNRTGNSAENLTVVRRITLNILKSDKSNRLSINKKRLKASFDNNYLLKILNHD
jgi:predicted transposase YbfD/YdcC